MHQVGIHTYTQTHTYTRTHTFTFAKTNPDGQPKTTGAGWEQSGRDGEEMVFLWDACWNSFDLGTLLMVYIFIKKIKPMIEERTKTRYKQKQMNLIVFQTKNITTQKTKKKKELIQVTSKYNNLNS